jgi:hypothetical protein
MRSSVQYSAAPVASTVALVTEGCSWSPDAEGAAVAPLAAVNASSAAAEKPRRLVPRDLRRVMVFLSNGWGRATFKPAE